ncbi:MAG: LytTR family DNA-binding domain-containing protein [Ruthenibacterium lactatiformans]
MNIRICEDPACADIEVVVRCRQLDDTVLSLLARLRVYDAKLTGERDGATYVLAAADVLYADTADKKTFLYTADAVYETPLRLYELEEQLAARGDFCARGQMAVAADLCPTRRLPASGLRRANAGDDVQRRGGGGCRASTCLPSRQSWGREALIPEKERSSAKKFSDIAMPAKTAVYAIFLRPPCARDAGFWIWPSAGAGLGPITTCFRFCRRRRRAARRADRRALHRKPLSVQVPCALHGRFRYLRRRTGGAFGHGRRRSAGCPQRSRAHGALFS